MHRLYLSFVEEEQQCLRKPRWVTLMHLYPRPAGHYSHSPLCSVCVCVHSMWPVCVIRAGGSATVLAGLWCVMPPSASASAVSWALMAPDVWCLWVSVIAGEVWSVLAEPWDRDIRHDSSVHAGYGGVSHLQRQDLRSL